MKTIFIIACGYPTKYYPLSCMLEFDQAKALRDAGCNVVYISVDLRSIRRKRKLGKYHLIKDGINIYNISVPLGVIPYMLLYTIGKWALQLIFKTAIKTEGLPDVLHAHFTFIGAISTELKKKYSIPLVVTEHSSEMNKSNISKESMFYAQKAYINSDKLICVSSALKKNIQRFFEINPIVIANMVDTENIKLDPVKHDKFTFVSNGSLIHGKGFDILLSAFKGMKSKYPQLYIIGSGERKKDITNLISNLQIEDRVKLLGLKSIGEISTILNKSDAFVLASRGETFGVVYIEAMLAGLPVIATRCGGPEDFVDETNGLFVDINNVEALTKAMDKMCEEYEKYDSKVISNNCLQKFSPSEISNQLKNIYKEITK